MYELKTLPIIGHDGEPLPHAFIRHENETKHLAILFPGLGYTSAMPLLFYAGDLLVDLGADLLRVDYDYSESAARGGSTEELIQGVMADSTAAGNAALAEREYERITLIGKSLGTVAVAHLLVTNARFRTADCIWLTPLLKDERLREAICRTAPRSLFVIGTADHHYKQDSLDQVLEATAGTPVVIEGADHGMEIEHDVFRSIDTLASIIRAIKNFLPAPQFSPS